MLFACSSSCLFKGEQKGNFVVRQSTKAMQARLDRLTTVGRKSSRKLSLKMPCRLSYFNPIQWFTSILVASGKVCSDRASNSPRVGLIPNSLTCSSTRLFTSKFAILVVSRAESVMLLQCSKDRAIWTRGVWRWHLWTLALPCSIPQHEVLEMPGRYTYQAVLDHTLFQGCRWCQCAIASR